MGPLKVYKQLLSCVLFLLLCRCDGPVGVSDLSVHSIEITGVAPAPDFLSTGEVSVGLIARGPDGNLISSENMALDVELIKPVCYGARSQTTEVVQAGAQPLAAALILDSSGSMADTDPMRDRVTAAAGFADAILSAGQANEVAAFDFGTIASAGFRWTRLLIGFTRDLNGLAAALDKVGADGITPLYESVIEVLEYIAAVRPQGSFRRIAVVLSDGQPNGPINDEDDAVSTSRGLAIPLYAIGLGTASVESPSSDPEAVAALQNLATRTGGLYASSSDPQALSRIFETLGTALGEGHLLHRFRISPIPPPGMKVELRIVATGGGAATFVFTAPPRPPSDESFSWPADPGNPADGDFADCGDWEQAKGCYWLDPFRRVGWRDASPFQRHLVVDNSGRQLGWHLGSDWNKGSGAQDRDSAVFATANGTVSRVVRSTRKEPWGNVLFVRHVTRFGEYSSMYAHVNWCDNVPPTEGEKVIKGQKIALVGNANGYYESAYHLHFEIRLGGDTVLGSAYTPTQIEQGEYGTGRQGQINPNFFIRARN